GRLARQRDLTTPLPAPSYRRNRAGQPRTTGNWMSERGGGPQGPWGSGPRGGRGGNGGGSGGPRGPWGGGRGGGGDDDNGRPPPRGPGPRPPDFEEMLRRSQDRFRQLLPGGRGTGTVIGVAIAAVVALWLASGFYRVQPDEVGV